MSPTNVPLPDETIRPAPAPPRGLQMDDVQRLVGELYLEIVFLRLEVRRLTPSRDGGSPPA